MPFGEGEVGRAGQRRAGDRRKRRHEDTSSVGKLGTVESGAPGRRTERAGREARRGEA
jgi:hypothetical protein